MEMRHLSKPAVGGETGAVGWGGAADPHGRTGRSGVNSSRPISGRSRGIKFACGCGADPKRWSLGACPRGTSLSISAIETDDYPTTSDVFDELCIEDYITSKGKRGIELNNSQFEALTDVLYYEYEW